MKFLSGHLVVTPGFAALLSASAYFGSLRLTGAFLLAATIHELGHLLVLHFMGTAPERLTLSACGAELTVRSELSFRRELLLCLAGPAANLLTGMGLSALGRWPLLLGASFLLCAFNLLPLRPLDGGNALFAFLSLVCAPDRAEQLTALFSRGAALAVLMLGGVLLGENGRPWLFFMGLWLTGGAFRRN